MPSERVQRQIDRLLDQAEAAAGEEDWARVADCARKVLAVDVSNEDAAAFLSMGEGQGSVPPHEARKHAASSSDAPPPPLPASFAGGRYAVRAFLGEGATKRVYLAHDSKLDRDVAFALIKTDGLDADGLVRVRREAQAMGKLDHPHIVTVYDTGDEDGPEGQRQPYIVSQYMPGGSVDALLAAAELHRLPIEQALRIADQMCDALAHAHGQGIVHRDLKPGNVWLANDGTAKLLDLGLAVALDRSRLTMEGMMIGTVAYMPPEQAMGRTADARSDLYALGAMLYEMVTGRPPFVGDDAVVIISQHLNTPPVAPSWHNPELPRALETLILRLLEKDPAQRPASASEVRHALAAIDLSKPPSIQASVITPAQPAGKDPIYRPTFVGRETESAQLHGVFDNALSGQGALVMVVGEPGIGKTSLCEQLATYAALRGGLALFGHCYEEGSLSLPYLPFVEALRSYVMTREPDALRSELGANAPRVSRIISEVRDRIEVELSPPGDPEEERYRLLEAVTAFLRSAAAVQPLLIVLEDLHDADRGTLDLLTHIARNLQGARLLIVGTYRDIEVDRTHPLASALAELRRATSFTRIGLHGLGPADVQRMLANIANREVPWSTAEAVHRQTEGNPLFVQEVVRYLVEEGLLRRDEGGGLRPTGDTPLLMRIPEGLRDVIGKRLSRLSAECNRVLASAAVVGREFPLDVLQDVAGVAEEQLFAALEEASATSVVEERRGGGSGVRYRFVHAFFRQTLYEELFTPRRIRLHQQVARAMERRYAGRLDEHAAELAEHFTQSTDAEDLGRAVEYSEMAAARSMSVFAYAEAARLLEQAIEAQEVLDPDDKAKRCDLLLALGNAVMPAGEPRRVADEIAPAALALAEALADDGRAARACVMAIGALSRHAAGLAPIGPEFRAWVERLDRVATPATAERVRADMYRSLQLFTSGQPAEGRTLALRALVLARELNDPDTLLHAVMTVSRLRNAPQHQRERLQLTEELANKPRDGVSVRVQTLDLLETGSVYLTWADRPRAEERWGQLAELAARSRDPMPLLRSLAAERSLALLDGRLEDVIASWERYVTLAGELGTVLPLPRFAELHRALLYLGQLDETALRARASDEWEGLLLYLPSVRALCLAHLGQSVEARALLLSVMSERGIGVAEDETSMEGMAWLLETAVLVEEREAATILAGRLAGVATLFTGACVARLLGAAAALLGEPAQARAHYEQALEVARKIRHRPEIALTRLQLAELLLENEPDERAGALAHLNFAIEEFRDMKMQPSLERALRRKVEAQGAGSTDILTSIGAVASTVQRDRTDLRPHAAADGSITIMFSDIEGSTPMNEQLGDQRWMELLRAHNALIREQIAAHDGGVVKTAGDGFMVAFQRPLKALHAAIAVQHAFALHNEQHAEHPLLVRIGIHTGTPVAESGDYYGKDVTLAYRIADSARGGEIVVSARVRGLVGESGEIEFGEPRELDLKGLSGTHIVHAVEWQPA